MVAAVVLAVGLIGSTLLLLDGLRVTRRAILASGAVHLAADLGDRIRVNRHAGGAYALPDGRLLALPVRTCNAPGACDAAAQAAADLYEWQQAVLATLPDARTAVELDDGVAGPRYTIAIEWNDGGRAGNTRYASVVAP